MSARKNGRRRQMRICSPLGCCHDDDGSNRSNRGEGSCAQSDNGGRGRFNARPSLPILCPRRFLHSVSGMSILLRCLEAVLRSIFLMPLRGGYYFLYIYSSDSILFWSRGRVFCIWYTVFFLQVNVGNKWIFSRSFLIYCIFSGAIKFFWTTLDYYNGCDITRS